MSNTSGEHIQHFALSDWFNKEPGMNSRLFAAACLLICCATLWSTRPAAAWGAAGHMIVAHIGEDNLTTDVKLQVQDLLGSQTMADVASWADDERSRHREQAG